MAFQVRIKILIVFFFINTYYLLANEKNLKARNFSMMHVQAFTFLYVS